MMDETSFAMNVVNRLKEKYPHLSFVLKIDDAEDGYRVQAVKRLFAQSSVVPYKDDAASQEDALVDAADEVARSLGF